MDMDNSPMINLTKQIFDDIKKFMDKYTFYIDEIERIRLESLTLDSKISKVFISKKQYENLKSKFDDINEKNRRAEIVSNNINDILNILDKFKDNLNQINKIYQEIIDIKNQSLIKINNQYLNTGSKLSELALNALPKDNKKLEKDILRSLDLSGETNEENRQNTIKNVTNQVEHARMMSDIEKQKVSSGIGGTKKRKYQKKRKCTKRKY